MVAVRPAVEPLTVAAVAPDGFPQQGLRDLFSHDLRFKLLDIAVWPQNLQTALTPDVLVLSAPAERAQAESLLTAARERFPSSACLVLTGLDNADFALSVLRAGGRALLFFPRTTPESLLEAAYQVGRADVTVVDRLIFEDVTRELAGGSARLLPPAGVKLTRQELNVLRHLANGLNDEEIARAMGIKRTTIETHVGNLRQKLPVSNRVQLGIYAVAAGLVDLRSIEFHT